MREDTYLVVSKMRDSYGNAAGVKLSKYAGNLDVGQIVKLGRVEYFVS